MAKDSTSKKKRNYSLERKIKRFLQEVLFDKFVLYTFVLILFFIGLLAFIYFAEKETNGNINTFFDVIWYSLVTVTTVGYGDISPTTVFGRIGGIVLLLVGVIGFAAVSGKVASVLFDRQLKRDRGRIKLKNISNHVIICGWKNNFERILEGVLRSNPDLTLDKIVLINTTSAENMENLRSKTEFKHINYINGDHTQESTLLMANIIKASRVLVLADYSQDYSQLEIDSRTVLAALTIANLNSKIYRVVELIDSSFVRHLESTHCDEIILTSDYERSLLVSASSGVGLSHILKYLLPEVSDEGLIIEDIDKNLIGKTYGEYRRTLGNPRSILIGLLENTGNFYKRRREAMSEAQKNPDMSQIVDKLKGIKSLQSNKPVLVPNDDYIIRENTKAIFVCGSAQPSEGVAYE